MILEHCNEKAAIHVAQKICDKMESFRFVHNNHRFRIGASIGLVTMDKRWPTAASLMQAADSSCFAAKDAGRNRVHVFCDTDHAIRTRHGDRAFHDYVCGLLERLEPLYRTKLCMEITETVAITNLTDASLFIERLKNFGVRIALDDFGAGASSFGYLKNLDVDVLKIDGQFIQDLLTDPLDEVAVRCFVDVANVVGLQTVAEFVAQEEVLAKVKELGIDFAQGFLLHRPDDIGNLFNGKPGGACGKYNTELLLTTR